MNKNLFVYTCLHKNEALSWFLKKFQIHGGISTSRDLVSRVKIDGGLLVCRKPLVNRAKYVSIL